MSKRDLSALKYNVTEDRSLKFFRTFGNNSTCPFSAKLPSPRAFPPNKS